ASTLGALDENPLMASLDVRLRSSLAAGTSVEALVDRVRATAGVSDVRYDKEWLDRLQRGVRLLRLIGFALGGALIVAAALTNALNLTSVHFLSPVLATGLVAGGLVVGCLAGLVASRRA